MLVLECNFRNMKPFLLTILMFFTQISLAQKQVVDVKSIISIQNMNISDAEDFLLDKDFLLKGSYPDKYGRKYYFTTKHRIFGDSFNKIVNAENENVYTEFQTEEISLYQSLKKQIVSNGFTYVKTFSNYRGINHLYSNQENQFTIDIRIWQHAHTGATIYTFRIIKDKFQLKIFGDEVLEHNRRERKNFELPKIE